MANFEKISTKDLLRISDKDDVCIIDVRPVEAYNGWKFNEEKRGGHIKNAKSLPFKWLEYIDWLEIVESKNILPHKTIVIYGYESERIEKTAQQFIKAGFPYVKIYDAFINEWVADTELPMQSLERYRHLVSAEWLKELYDTGTVLEYDQQRYVICHAHYQNRQDYEKGHIPGAVDLDTNSLESQETWNRRSPQELKKVLQSKGIDQDTTVILYGRFSSPDFNDPFPGSRAGHLGAMRCAFIMLYAGVKDVRILNGGIQSWLDAGFELTTEDIVPDNNVIFEAEIPSCPEYAVDTPEAKKILQAPDKNLVSVRSWREFIGEVSGYHYIKKKGRIPGAVFGNCGTDAYHMENYRNPDHTTREYHEIEKNWAEAGITPDKHNAFYCGTGWRGSEAFMNAWLMGWPRVSVYDGGWFEWSNDPSNPYETGLPDK